jgi:hypothetical protein
MIVQWCCKGLARLDETSVRDILSNEVGLRCRGWLSVPPGQPFPIATALGRLTEGDLDLHVNGYSTPDPGSGRPYHEVTPFISLSAGCVDRDVAAKTNVTHRALRTALQFATTDFSQPSRPACAGWVLLCYVLVSVNRAVTVPAVAEEIRELNHNRAYSDWYWQGEVTAKIHVPSTQILCATRWETGPAGRLDSTGLLVNPRFTHPSVLLDERSAL